MAGIWIVALKVLRGEEASIGDAFGGFSKFWWPLVGANFLITVVTVLPLIPFGGSLLPGATKTWKIRQTRHQSKLPLL